MTRGTTPTHTFKLPVSKEKIKNLRLTYKQKDKVLLNKMLSDITLDGSNGSITLTQQETLKFEADSNAYFQLRILTTDNKVFASKAQSVWVEDTFNEEVLV